MSNKWDSGFGGIDVVGALLIQKEILESPCDWSELDLVEDLFGMAEKGEPLLKKLYYENCPGCKVEKINETQEGLPVKNFFYAWALVLSCGNNAF